MGSAPPLEGFIRVGGKWKIIPSNALLGSQPRAMLDRKIAEAKAMTAAIDLTAAEIDAGEYPTRALAMETLTKRLDRIMAATTRPTATAATTTAARPPAR